MEPIFYKESKSEVSLNADTSLSSRLEIQIVSDPKDILKYLQLGISIPILQEFHKYILLTFEAYKAKAILLKEKFNTGLFSDHTDNVIGMTLVYDDGQETMFFGFFGIYDHNKHKISFLVDKLIEYAKEHKYSYIRGPVNIPAVIFGWGFMVEGSSKSLFVGCPVNPPVYQRVFLKKGFYVKFEEDRYDVVVIKMNPHTLKRRDGSLYDFSDYEVHNPPKDKIMEYREDMKSLHINYMPPSAQISPAHPINFKVHFDFIYKYGTESHIWVVYYKPTGKMVAWGYIIPNPFNKDRRGRTDSVSFHYWVVHPEHRRSGLAMLMYGATSLKVYREGLRWGSWPVGSENKANAAAARKMKGVRDRRHLILEFQL